MIIKSLDDIAKKAGVSTATVSRVINSSDKVAKKTRERILKIIEDSGYIPNDFARSLRSNKKNMIAIIIPYIQEIFLSYTYFSIFLNSLIHTMSKRGINTIVSLEYEEDQSEVYFTYKKMISQNLVDGFVVLGLQKNDKRISFLNENDVKYVVIGHDEENEGDYIYVDIDNIGGAYKATKYLLEKGKTKILFINGQLTDCSSFYRQQGYINALKDTNTHIDKDLIINVNDLNERLTYQILIQQAKQKDFDAVFTTSDTSAIGVIKALKDLKLSVPVVGFDDLPIASVYDPPLTTISQPIAQVASLAGEKLYSLIEGEKVESQILDVELVER